VHGSVKCSFDTGFLARDILERVRARTLPPVAGHDVVGRVGQFLFPFPLVSRNFKGALGVDGSFEEAPAEKSPGGDDHLVHQKRFDGIDGGETVAEGCRVGFEVVGAFGGDEDLRGGEAVFYRVQAGASLAFPGPRTSAALGVAVIRRDLFFGGHA